MAAKAPAKSANKTSKGVKSSKTTRANAGFSAAQNKAYQAASKAAIQKAQLKISAHALQARRLQAAVKVQGKLRAKGQQAFAARIKVLAVHRTYFQTVYGKQQSSLRVQAAHRLFKAQSVATNRQFAYLGEAIHARTTTLQTLTDAQALTAAQRLSAAAAKTVLGRKPRPASKRKAATGRSPYASIGAAAGKAAASRVGRSAKSPVSKTRKAARVTPTVNPEWITAGNDLGEDNCIAVAIANHLYYHTGYRLTDEQVDAADYDRLNKALWMVCRTDPWLPYELLGYRPVEPVDARPGMLAGFEVVVNGKAEPHCGVLMPDSKVVSWGEIVPLESAIEEAWEATWMTKAR